MSADETISTLRPTAATHWNADLIEEMYEQWKTDPDSVSSSWQLFFQGFELAMCPRPCVSNDAAQAQTQVNNLINTYRRQGHLVAQIDPLDGTAGEHPDLDIKQFGFGEHDHKLAFSAGGLAGKSTAALGEILEVLKKTYCGPVGVEYMHIQDPLVRKWLQERMEPGMNRPAFDRGKKLQILDLLTDGELFETFIHTHYPGQKRFSLEGAEMVVPALAFFMELAPELGVQEVVLGMAHRGRLNVLANILRKSYSMIFAEFEHNFIPDSVWGSGDVKYHKGYSADYTNLKGNTVHVSLTANPSHLEAVGPVVEGRARAKQRQRDDTAGRSKVVPLLIHGDAAFSGQGIVAETFNLSQLEGYRTGGTVHFIVNNQIGFTAVPEEERSTMYATDVAKMVEAPIFHVNGDDPEAVVYVTELALRFRQRFGRDVVVDMLCYRRHGHNEGDDPAFTQPVMYKKIRKKPSVRKMYTDRLLESGDLSAEREKEIASEFRSRLESAFKEMKEAQPEPELDAYEGYWEGLDYPYTHEPVETGVEYPRLLKVAEGLSRSPEGFSPNRKVHRRFQQYLETLRNKGSVDWGFAELLSLGSLLTEGTPVRLSGQDSARGTFSQRHAIWYDAATQKPYIPARHLDRDQARLCVYNSMLSEAAVLGFEYGYSLVEPHMLILWEAQFGDFANGAQVIIDQFLTAAGSKWQRSSGLVLLLPHGYEGQGPEHSNAYLERYLAASAEHNIQVCNPTTPAQYFHVLRRQMKRPFRRPLIVMTPKSLLRHKMAASPTGDLVSGRFHEILDDPDPPASPRRVVFCSGKVYYDIHAARIKQGVEDVALVRIEQLYPLNNEGMRKIVERYQKAPEVIWAQEEPQNRGAWSFIRPRLEMHFFDGRPIRYVGRRASASPATGSLRIHRVEQEKLVHDALIG
jgi:2-oxoglutarate dehydrogenase E1 component